MFNINQSCGYLCGCLNSGLSLLLLAVVKQYQEYVEPDSNSTTRLTTSATDEDGEKTSELPPLGENVLTNNLGIPIVVAITKVLISSYQSMMMLPDDKIWLKVVLRGGNSRFKWFDMSLIASSCGSDWIVYVLLLDMYFICFYESIERCNLNIRERHGL